MPEGIEGYKLLETIISFDLPNYVSMLSFISVIIGAILILIIILSITDYSTSIVEKNKRRHIRNTKCSIFMLISLIVFNIAIAELSTKTKIVQYKITQIKHETSIDLSKYKIIGSEGETIIIEYKEEVKK